MKACVVKSLEERRVDEYNQSARITNNGTGV
jgi:hypothetical protein